MRRAGARPPEPEPQPEGPFVLPHLGEWTVRDVERLLDEQGDAFPDRREELEVYLDSFRGVAGTGRSGSPAASRR